MDAARFTATAPARPARSPAWKYLRLLALAAAVVSVAAWWDHTPREPKHQGRRLSSWMNEMGHGSGVFRLSHDDLKAMGPDALTWLTWAVEYGHLPPHRDPPPYPRSRFKRLWNDARRVVFPGRVDEGFNERAAALRVIPMLGSDAAPAIPTLVHLLADPAQLSKPMIASTLAQIAPSARSLLAQAYEDGDQSTRLAILNVAGGLREVQPVDGSGKGTPPTAAELDWIEQFYLKAFDDPDPETRISAAAGLAAIDQSFPERRAHLEIIPVLIAALPDTNNWIRYRAADALGRLGPKAATTTPDVIQLLNNPSLYVRIAAMDVLVKIDAVEQRSKLRLQELLTDPDLRIRTAAKEALKNFAAPPAK